MRFTLSKGVSEKAVWVTCPYADTSPLDDCTPKKRYKINIKSQNAQELMREHIDRHTQAESNKFGLRIKRYGCQVCEWTSEPFQSNNALTQVQIGSEEAEALDSYEQHMITHSKCENHTTPGEQSLVYYFKSDEDKVLHDKVMHKPMKAYTPRGARSTRRQIQAQQQAQAQSQPQPQPQTQA